MVKERKSCKKGFPRLLDIALIHSVKPSKRPFQSKHHFHNKTTVIFQYFYTLAIPFIRTPLQVSGLYSELFLILSGLYSELFLILSGLYSELFLILSGLYSELFLILSGLYSELFLILSGLYSELFFILSDLSIFTVLFIEVEEVLRCQEYRCRQQMPSRVVRETSSYCLLLELMHVVSQTMKSK